MNHALFSLTGRLTRRDFALTLGVISGGVFFAMLALCYLLFPLTASAAVGFFRDSAEVFFTVYIAAFLGLNLLLYALIPPLAIPCSSSASPSSSSCSCPSVSSSASSTI